MNPNSLEAWYEIRDNLGPRQAQVLGAIEALRTATLEQICIRLGLFPNQVSGRITELKEQGLISIVGKAKNMYGRTVDVYASTRPQPQQLNLGF